MKNILFIVVIAVLLILIKITSTPNVIPDSKFFSVQSIDTMKYSRDSARANLSKDKIYAQVAAIAQTGATHVAIDTPYDSEFLPVLTIWVAAARNYNLNVWFRGNFSGWEGWFDYPKTITRSEHINKTRDFILNNSDLFEDGDIFTACPECENGASGDPRQTGDTAGFRKFIIDEYNTTSDAFKTINKKVTSNYFSMNGDVAKLIMDKATTTATGGIITVDHYVATPDKLSNDIDSFAVNSGGNVVLGEFGAPIPDINGNLSESDQAQWIDDAFNNFLNHTNIVGLNYWTNMGSSTSPWNEDTSRRKAVDVITKYFDPKQLLVTIYDTAHTPIKDVNINYLDKNLKTNKYGQVKIPYVNSLIVVNISNNIETKKMNISEIISKHNNIFIKRFNSIISL